MQFTINEEFWSGKRVFITGHTGFKGSWLSIWLQSMGAKVKGFALSPPTSPSLFEQAKVADGMISEIGDIRNLEAVMQSMNSFDPEILIHMAAQPLVRLSYLEPVETYAINVMGTVNVLEAARKCPSLKAIVNVTTDKCYENREWVWGYRENEPMGGYDPYSNSKGCSELVTAAYRNSYFNKPESASLATARAGNVIGGGDWAADRLIPDILRAFEKLEPLVIRNPNAIRPWQHVLEPLRGYLMLAEKLYTEGKAYAEGWNFGPRQEDTKNVMYIINFLSEKWEGETLWKLENESQPYEAKYLSLDISKAKQMLNWEPFFNINTALKLTHEFYLGWASKCQARDLVLEQIKCYMNQKDTEWEL